MPIRRVAVTPHDSSPHDIATAWLVTFTSVSTRTAYGRDLQLFVEWLAHRGVHPFEVTEVEFAEYRDHHQRSSASVATVQRRLASVSSFYRFAVGSEAVARNPAGAPRNVRLSVESPTRSLDDRERDNLWTTATELGPRSAALVGLILFDGLKLFEALALDVANVTATASAKPGAGVTVGFARRGAVVHLHLDRRTAPQVEQIRRRRSAGPLFVGESMTVGGSRLTRFGADYLLKQAGAAAGLGVPLTANQLRSTHISDALRRTGDAESVRESVGHADRRTTLRYRSRP
jgi:integrase/recombinase XerD